MAKQRGLTLLEMLVSIVILTTVISLVATAWGYYVSGFNNSHQKLSNQFSQMRRSLSWQDQLAAAFYFYVGVDNRRLKPLFKGEKDNVFWVATTSTEDVGSAALAWLGVEDSYLTYCEMPLRHTLVTRDSVSAQMLCDVYKQQIEPAESLQIQYYGWPGFSDRLNATSEAIPGLVLAKPAWFNQYQAEQTSLLPMWIKLQLTFEDETLEYWVTLENNDVQKQGMFMGEFND